MPMMVKNTFNHVGAIYIYKNIHKAGILRFIYKVPDEKKTSNRSTVTKGIVN